VRPEQDYNDGLDGYVYRVAPCSLDQCVQALNSTRGLQQLVNGPALFAASKLSLMLHATSILKLSRPDVTHSGRHVHGAQQETQERALSGATKEAGQAQRLIQRQPENCAAREWTLRRCCNSAVTVPLRLSSSN
jgi:hypothetical protein